MWYQLTPQGVLPRFKNGQSRVSLNTIFKKRIAHGMIGVSLISGCLTKLMGDGNIWLSQSINFLKPIFIGDTLTAHLIVTAFDKRKVANISIKIMNDSSELVIDGYVRSMQFYH